MNVARFRPSRIVVDETEYEPVSAETFRERYGSDALLRAQAGRGSARWDYAARLVWLPVRDAGQRVPLDLPRRPEDRGGSFARAWARLGERVSALRATVIRTLRIDRLVDRLARRL